MRRIVVLCLVLLGAVTSARAETSVERLHILSKENAEFLRDRVRETGTVSVTKHRNYSSTQYARVFALRDVSDPCYDATITIRDDDSGHFAFSARCVLPFTIEKRGYDVHANIRAFIDIPSGMLEAADTPWLVLADGSDTQFHPIEDSISNVVRNSMRTIIANERNHLSRVRSPNR